MLSAIRRVTLRLSSYTNKNLKKLMAWEMIASVTDRVIKL